MFTGIVQARGAIAELQHLDHNQSFSGIRLTVNVGTLSLDDVALGDSIAINGACMTVTSFDIDQGVFSCDVSHESLSKTTGLNQMGQPINLEKAMRLADRLGGHMVSGHVDDVGRIVSMDQVGESTALVIAVAAKWQRFLAEKGSVVIDGVSLTVNRVWQEKERAPEQAQEQIVQVEPQILFSINLIPHTIANTIFEFKRPGDQVNFEVDLLARYLDQLLSARGLL